jgi:hypothetical protein
MKSEPSTHPNRIPVTAWHGCLLAATVTLAAAQDPPEMTTLRDEYGAKCEEARKEYTAALREATQAAAVAAVAATESPPPLGEARYVTQDLPESLYQSAGIRMYQFRKPAKPVAGLNSEAVIESVNLPLGKLAVAVDYSSDLEQMPDLLRFDFSGKGIFTAENTAKLDPGDGDRDYVHFGPQSIKVVSGNKTIPVSVWGVFDARLHMDIQLGVGPIVEASCGFGPEVYRVRLAETGGHLEFVRGKASRRNSREAAGSRLFVDATGDGSFAVKGVFGQPVRVDGKWYDIVLDGMVMSARPLEVGTAGVVFPAGTRACMLAGKDWTYDLSYSTPLDAVPAGSYAIREYYLDSASPLRGGRSIGPGERGWLAATGAVDEKNEPKLIEFPANQVTEVPIGEPLMARVVAKRTDAGVRLALEVTDRDGGRISLMRLPRQLDLEDRSRPFGDSRPAPPKVTVTAADGKVVYGTLMRYGGTMGHPESIACAKVWQPPPELKGRFTITVEFSASPFKTQTEATELVIE